MALITHPQHIITQWRVLGHVVVAVPHGRGFRIQSGRPRGGGKVVSFPHFNSTSNRQGHEL